MPVLLKTALSLIIWAATWQNQQNGMCAQRRLRSAWASAQSNQSLLFAWRKLGSLVTHWAHSEDWSDWADAQADLGLRWAHRLYCWFCHEAAHISVHALFSFFRFSFPYTIYTFLVISSLTRSQSGEAMRPAMHAKIHINALVIKKVNRKVQEEPQAEAAANPRLQEEDWLDGTNRLF